MKKFLLILIFAVSLSASAQLTYNGKPYYLHGANLPWHYCGADFGNHYQWGSLYDSTWFENQFAQCEVSKLNTIRVWIHTDGRSSPEFDATGSVTGLDANFFSNMDDMLNRAGKHKLMVILCLWSFDMCKDNTAGGGMYSGKHANLITDQAKTQSYINNALIPMVQRYANQCNLLAYEIINEPEWAMQISGGGNTTQTVTAKNMQRFVGMCADAIHWYSAKMVTVGSACLKWNSDKKATKTPCAGNYWKNSAIKAAYPGSRAYLDFYQVHYYDWMATNWIFDPFNPSYPASYWLLDKPTIVGEAPPKSTKHSNRSQLARGLKNKFAGVLFWSNAATDGIGTFTDFNTSVKSFSDSLSGKYLFASCTTVLAKFFGVTTVDPVETQKETFAVFPNPANSSVQVEGGFSNVVLSVYDLAGRMVYSEKLNPGTNRFDVSRWERGVYLFSVQDNSGVSVKKIILE